MPTNKDKMDELQDIVDNSQKKPDEVTKDTKDDQEQEKKSKRNSYSQLSEKYKKMKENREKYSIIDISDFLPTIDEMMKEDCVVDLLEEVGSSINNEKNSAVDVAYYSVDPFSTEPGYYEDKEVFVLRPKKGPITDIDNRTLGNVDGDTLKFDLSQLDSGGSFNFKGSNYKSFQDYIQKMCNSTDRSTVCVRLAGINTPEIPHYSAVAIHKDQKIEKKTIGELKELKSMGKTCEFLPYELSENNTKVSDRRNSEQVEVYVNNGCYYELLPKSSGISNAGASVFLREAGSYDKDYNIRTMVAVNETTKGTIVDGYKAQKALFDLLGGGKVKDWILLLDASTQTYKRTYSTYTAYATLYKFGDNIKNLIKAWIDATKGYSIQLTRLNYAPFGMDVYGRSLGTLYVQVETDAGKVWIDTSKYVLANTDSTVAFPDVNGSAEIRNIGDGFSDAINVKSYQQNSTRYVDNLDVKGVDSYNAKIELHKQLTGIDFTKMKDCTVMLGDTLFLIPPQSIRNVNSVDYERVPVLRGKGTMTKNLANREQLLEIDFYFYGESGINGIPYEATLPNGEKITYYMNGLRALLSQFRLAPFLPIENTYINNVLGIEVVALVNFNISTVDGFPKLLRATLTLRDFNYTVYMPDLPISYYGDEDNVNALGKSSVDQIFGKCFEWELFRYYYQRALIHGEKLSTLGFNTFGYGEYFYSYKNLFQPNDLKDNYIEFYIPDEQWLKGALQYKKSIDYTGQFVADLSLKANETQFLKQVASIQEQIKSATSSTSKLNTALDDTKSYYFSSTKLANNENVLNRDIFNSSSRTSLFLASPTKTYPTGIELLRKRIHDDICDKLADNSAVSYTYTNEIFSPLNDGSGGYNIIWRINIVLDTSGVSNLDNIREVVKSLSGASSPNNCLVDETVQFDVSARFMAKDDASTNGGYVKDSISCSTSDDFSSIINAYYENDDDDANLAGVNQSMFDYTKYKEPECMKFVPYLCDKNGKSKKLDVDMIAFNMSNTFTEMYLKACDGYAPQYMGGSDVTVELKMTLTDEDDILYNLNKLPTVVSQYTKTYRRVMPCYPLKVKNSYLQTLGLNEMLIDNIQIETIDGFPGAYEVTMRMTSVDRSLRQREALRKVDSESYTTTISESSIVNMFALQNELAKAELYPDLDLPTVDELAENGWKFLKYSNDKRLFVDPDFYIVYSFKYTAQILKELMFQYVYKTYLGEGGLEKIKKNSYRYEDSSGMKLNAHLDQVLGSSFENANEYSELYDSIVEDIDSQSTNEKLKKILGQETYDEIKDTMEIGTSIEYLTATGITDGWELRDGFVAVLSDSYTNQCVENLEVSGVSKPDAKDEDKDNEVYKSIYDMRAKAIHLIDKILEEPLTYTTDSMEEEDLSVACKKAVNNMFIKNSNGKELIKLLNGGEEPKEIKEDAGFSSEYNSYRNYSGFFQEPEILNFIAGYLYSTAYSFSSTKETKKLDVNGGNLIESIKDKLFDFVDNANGEKDDADIYDNLMFLPEHYNAKTKNPFVKVKDTNLKETKINLHDSKINGDWDKLLDSVYAAEAGGTFGMCKISTYSIDELKLMLLPDECIKYKYDNKEINKMYPKETNDSVFCQNNAFIDPYYNKAGHRSSSGKKYKEYIIKYPVSNAEAQLRIVLLFLKRMIVEGYYFNEVDVIQGDYDTIKEQLKQLQKELDPQEIAKKLLEDGTITQEQYDAYVDKSKETDVGPIDDFFGIFEDIKGWVRKIPFVGSLVGLASHTSDSIFGEMAESSIGNDVLSSTLGLSSEDFEALLEELPKTYRKVYCARMIYPFVAAITKYDDSIMKYVRERNYSTLNTFTASVVGNCDENDKFNLFLSSLADIGLVEHDKVNNGTKETTTVSQKVGNQLMKEAFTACANDPTKYVLHSFYDMVVNDKRGRLLRAFPTYYLVFIDEGRKIGTWKLYDNFYNMSSISELQIVKSRKIPADTCTFTMSNLYMSYTDTYDNSIYQQYVDVYGVKDLVDSLFFPEALVNKEDAIRRRKQLKDTTVISPGVRIHVRLGYGSDASKMPIVFNGKIAEINCGETVEVVCQGDGHELCNPLNTLGEITAKSFQTSQHYITWFKDIRGSFMRGGESPRNLSAKLLNAEYNGSQKILRDMFNQRFYADNPFGIYHFGDRRYQDIFEEGETVQNLYEVSNESLLMGYNTLMNDKSANASTPTINCTLQDKTFWEILNLCANSGDGYYAAIRDFGFRSTACLCKANHYYAYEYRKKNGVVYEKRKPFQQFHYYDSYNDIVYNTIKASEKNMKTNAVGTWQSTDIVWGTSQDTVGPIFLDMNIYPEYQKSMTVDTGLVGGGNGGLQLGLTTHYSEQWTMSEMDNKVNKSLAEKVTTNVLRNSVKDMYDGELCIMGDPTAKPFDTMCFSDVYEDMSGTTEIETVIHTFNATTGFTTTLVPDLITCTESIEERTGAEVVRNSFITAAGIQGLRLGASWLIKEKLGLSLTSLTGRITSVLAGQVKGTVTSIIASLLGGKISSSGNILASFGLSNPIGVGVIVATTAATFIMCQNLKDSIYRALKNIQAITVFPITKNQRPLVAGMAGHKGSVYGYPYPDGTQEDSIQSMIMTIFGGENIVSSALSGFMSGYNLKGLYSNWTTSLGIGDNNELLSDSYSAEKNKTIFMNEVYNTVSKEFSNRSSYIQSLKTQPRITKFDTSNNTSEEYLKYQIGGLYTDPDKEEYADLPDSEKKYVEASELSENKKLTALSIVEEDEDIKLAINGKHPIIREFNFSHSANNAQTVNLIRESGNRKVRYLVDNSHRDKGTKAVFDFPMIHEDAMSILKIIINSTELKNCKVVFASGVRVNDIRSWKSTGFAFSLQCNNFEALKKAVEDSKKNTKWYNSSDPRLCFNYGINEDSELIAITAYAPKEK